MGNMELSSHFIKHTQKQSPIYFYLKSTSMTATKKAALYDPYLDTLGGGERHILSILKVLEDSGYEITVFWDTDLTQEIENKLNLTFQHLTFQPNIFRDSSRTKRNEILRGIDQFFYVTDGSYFFSQAKKTSIFCMVPKQELYQMNFLNRAKTWGNTFIANSEFTASWLSKWGIKPQVIYPYLSEDFFLSVQEPKDKIILNVGRFFKQLHSKRQDIAIQWFQELQKRQPKFTDYKLILAGSCMPEDEVYLNELKAQATNNEHIEFKVNIPFSEMVTLYNKAEYYWHFAGFEVDENVHPEQTEHLGITPMEAMARGCLTFAYRAGGPKEIIDDGKTGYLFTTQAELFEKMNDSQKDAETIKQTAIEYIQSNFSYEVFKRRVIDVILTK